MYDSYHEMEIVKRNTGNDDKNNNDTRLTATIVGNICESGDILARDREIKAADVGDKLVIFNAGAYGYVMSSNYNCRLRPAEVLIDLNGEARLIRKRDTLESLAQNFPT
jgi:diaminopimelate decarboxylase